jgi:membrane protein
MDAKSGQDQGRDVIMTHGVLSENPEDLFYGKGWRVPLAVLREAILRLWSDDAFGLAGNVAFRALLAIFPFLIFTSSMTAFVGDRSMADDLVTFLIAIVPPPLIEPIVSEVEQVMTVPRGGVLSIGILLTIWFAVGGVDGVRIGLNRAYGIRETRSTVVLFGVQIAMVVLASLILVLVGYLLVLAPRAGSWLHTLMPGFDPASVTVSLIRFPEPPRVYRRVKLSENCPLWNRHKRRRHRSRIHPSSVSVRCGWLWNTAMSIRAKVRR